MSIEHEYFGLVDSDGAGGLYWSDVVELGDQSVSVDLTAHDEDEVDPYALDAAAAILRSLEPLDARARDALVAELSERQSATSNYVDRNIEELGDSLIELLVDTSGDLAIDILKSILLMRVAIQLEHTGGEEAFAVFDYSINPESSDEVLVVSFDDRGDVVEVDTTS